MKYLSVTTLALVTFRIVAAGPPATDAPDAPAANPTVSPPALLTLPDAQLAALPGFDSDEVRNTAVASEVAELLRRAGEESEPEDFIQLQLASANLILAKQLEPACSRRLSQTGIDPGRHDAPSIAAQLDQADHLIAAARKVIKSAAGSDSDAADQGFSPARRQAESLAAFAEALRVYLLPDETPDAARAARRAASRLAAMFEDEDPATVAAATLWHAVLRAREKDASPALAVLDRALADPVPAALPHALFSRILRCRLVAEHGSPSAALALLVQMEDLCDAWFDEESTRADALRTVVLTELQMLRDWRDRLDAKEEAAERSWCAESFERIRSDGFTEAKTLLRLGHAIPLLVKPPPPSPAPMRIDPD